MIDRPQSAVWHSSPGPYTTDALLLLTDVAAIERDHGTPAAAPVGRATPDELRALHLPGGSVGPKAEAAAWFAEATGGQAAIGALEHAVELWRVATTVAARLEVGSAA